MKIFNTTLIQKDNKLFVEYYTMEKPIQKSGMQAAGSYINDLKIWQQSKQLVEVHPSQEGSFWDLVDKSDSHGTIEQGIEIPNDNIEIKYDCQNGSSMNCSFCDCKNYAFFYENTISKEVKEECKDHRMMVNSDWTKLRCGACNHTILVEKGLPLETPQPKVVLPLNKEMARNAFEQSRLTHPMVGFKYDTFEDWLASYKGEGEPNQEELWRNLRNDFFAECTDKKMKQIGTAFVQVPAINMAPHDLFEWFKYKITKL